MQGLLYEATTVLLKRTRVDSDLRPSGLKLHERLGFKRAMLRSGHPNRSSGTTFGFPES